MSKAGKKILSLALAALLAAGSITVTPLTAYAAWGDGGSIDLSSLPSGDASSTDPDTPWSWNSTAKTLTLTGPGPYTIDGTADETARIVATLSGNMELEINGDLKAPTLTTVSDGHSALTASGTGNLTLSGTGSLVGGTNTTWAGHGVNATTLTGNVFISGSVKITGGYGMCGGIGVRLAAGSDLTLSGTVALSGGNSSETAWGSHGIYHDAIGNDAIGNVFVSGQVKVTGGNGAPDNGAAIGGTGSNATSIIHFTDPDASLTVKNGAGVTVATPRNFVNDTSNTRWDMDTSVIESPGVVTDQNITVNIPASPGSLTIGLAATVSPDIVTHPTNQSVTEGYAATFSVAASSIQLAYQWQVDKQDGSDFQNVTDGTGWDTAQYTTPITDIGMDGYAYRVAVSNPVGSVLSNVVFLSVNATDSTAPTISGINPANGATDAAISGDIVITFDEPMDTLAGAVSLTGGSGSVNSAGSWNGPTNTVYTIGYSGLDYSTTYTITAEDFKDVAGNVMTSNPATYFFTTKVQPTGPDVSPATLNLDLASSASSSGSITISFGQSGNQAGQADLTGFDTTIISLSETSVTTGAAITVIGLTTGSTDISIGFSGGDLASPTNASVRVNVTDSTPRYTVTYADGGVTGGSIPVDSSNPYNSGAAVTVMGNTGGLYKTNHTFAGWKNSVDGKIYNAGNTFAITDNTTLTAQWAYNGTTSTGSSSGSSTTTPTYNWDFDKTAKPYRGKLTLTNAPNAEGILNATITKGMVQDAINKGGSNNILEFVYSTTKTINGMNITFDADALALLETSGCETFVTANAFKFGLDLAAIKEIRKQNGNMAATISAYKTDKTAAAFANSIRKGTAWDISISYKKSGETKYIENLGNGKFMRGIKYAPTDTDKTGNLAMVRQVVSGQAVLMEFSSYDNGFVIGTGNSCSIYGVVYKAPAVSFTDTTGHWAKDDIDFAVSRGLISGTGTTFAPNTAITRADFLMALGKLSSADVSGYTQSSFTDVSNTDPAMPYIEWATQSDIVHGIGGGNFGSDQQITREQMAVMMVNYAKSTNYKLPISRDAITFVDNGKINAWAADAVKSIQQAGIINGKDNNIFDPQGNATRAEASAILRRFVESVIDEGTARGWVKNESGHWMYINTYGKAVTGWLTSGENKYYFDTNGNMVSGKWLQIGGKWYYFYSDGKLAVNTTIDGYKIGADGERK